MFKVTQGINIFLWKKKYQGSSSVHGISQARMLEWVALSFSRDLPNLLIETESPTLASSLPLRHQESPSSTYMHQLLLGLFPLPSYFKFALYFL